MPPPIDVRRRVYDKPERVVIDRFKTDYMACTSPEEWKTFATAKIFPNLFNYWAEQGVDLNNDEMDKRTEVCCMC